MKANGAFTVLVSGGFTFFTRRVAERAGFHANHANQLEITDSKMTGKAISPILGREAKLRTLERYTKELGLDPMLTLAVGDGANDLAMIKAAGLGVAYRAKPIVAAQAAASIRYANLEALLYLQGYRRAEFAGR
jgi:phosphoserine phosphatase